jgi:hypothetical protein
MAATCDQCGAPVEYGQPTAATAAGDGPVNA